MDAALDANTDAAPTDAADLGSRPAPGAYVIPFAPEPVGGTPLVLADDQLSSPVPIGFAFRFFDETHDTVSVSSNGYVTFASSVTGCGCAARTIPALDDVNDVMAYAWTDLFPPGGGSLTFETRGVAPARRFVLSATDQQWYPGSLPSVTTQLILREGTDFIEMHTTRQASGRVYTQGVEDAQGRTAYFLCGRVAADYSLTDDGVLFVTY